MDCDFVFKTPVCKGDIYLTTYQTLMTSEWLSIYSHFGSTVSLPRNHIRMPLLILLTTLKSKIT